MLHICYVVLYHVRLSYVRLYDTSAPDACSSWAAASLRRTPVAEGPGFTGSQHLGFRVEGLGQQDAVFDRQAY